MVNAGVDLVATRWDCLGLEVCSLTENMFSNLGTIKYGSSFFCFLIK
jgi:hypothetical protein